MLEELASALVNVKQSRSVLRFASLFRIAEGDPRHGHAHFLRYDAHRLGEADVFYLLHKAENISRSPTAKTVIELPRRVYRKRRCFLAVEWTQPGVILRARLLQPDVISHHAYDIRLLL